MVPWKVSGIFKIQGTLFQRNISAKTKSESEKKSKNKFSHTVQLPSTQFPLWVKPQDRAKLDEKINKECGFSELYSWQREALKDRPEFVLHDGPPYANGSPHIGHAVNKILKDITLRSNLLQRKKVHYVPGWDCHGLPIELKAITSKDRNLNAIEIRQKARSFASETIQKQKAEFESWGVLADWKSNCYHTFDKNYVKNQLRQFYSLYKKNYIYRDLKPVYWSPSSRTALAESELEYKSDHVSKSVYLKLKLTQVPEILSQFGSDLHVLIWTTTPWSLPSNQFIAFSPNLEYSVASINQVKVIVAKCLLDSLKETMQADISVLCDFQGTHLQGATYVHPINKGLHDLKLLPAEFVSASKGTGLVHCAPAHGQDDFLLALALKIPVLNVLNERGQYSATAGSQLEGLHVLTEGKDKVLNLIQEDVICTEDYTHSYPYDWRTKKPVILKASQQWFIDTARIKPKALECLNSVNFIPETARNSLRDIIEQRPYWCISRQRVWGVPIPVLYDGDTILLSKTTIDHFCNLIDEHGTDFWWSLSTENLLNISDSNSVVKSKDENLLNISDLNSVVKSKDILDIWFDSGLSWSAVLQNKQADVYMEGMDQINGWFISSLLTSVALKQSAPFRNVFLHGFVVDEKGSKMSKSVGNVISARDILHGAKKLPAHGVDVLRWWVVAHASKDPTVPIGKNILNSSLEDVQKIRSALRYLLGVLKKYEPPSTARCTRSLDVYVLKQLYEFQNSVDTLYSEFQFAKVSRVLLNFVTNQLSALYFSLVKDRLYCDSLQGEGRLSGLFTLHYILQVLLRTVAPVMPHLAEEVYLYHKPGYHFFHTTKLDISNFQQQDTSAIEAALLIRNEVNINIPESVNRLKLHVSIEAGDEIFSLVETLLSTQLAPCDSELCELLQVSSVELLKSHTLASSGFQTKVTEGSGHQCPRCRRFSMFNTSEEMCTRCDSVVNAVR